MTLRQARKRYPNVPDEIIRWALDNIPDPKDCERGLRRLDQARQLQLRYGV
jgi:hypothetical protein